MSALTVSGVTKSFPGGPNGPTPVLTGVDLTVPEGTLTALLGPSGCGKTTLLRLVAGFEDPDAGTVALGDRVVAAPGVSVPARRRGIGFVPQEGGLFPHLSVAGNVTFGLPRRQRRDAGRVRELLALVGLDAALADRQPHQLSGGQQQRVALARALAPAPSLVLLDEPFSSLDASLREETRAAVAAALSATGATAVLVTHDQAEALSMADQVAVVRGGRLVQLAAPRELYAHPRDLGVATSVGDAVVLDAEVAGGRAHCALGVLPLERTVADGPARVVLRPEQVRLDRVGPDGPAGRRARVREVDFYGHDARVWLDLAGGGSVSARTDGLAVPAVGDEVAVTVVGAALGFPPATQALAGAAPVAPAGPVDGPGRRTPADLTAAP